MIQNATKMKEGEEAAELSIAMQCREAIKAFSALPPDRDKARSAAREFIRCRFAPPGKYCGPEGEEVIVFGPVQIGSHGEPDPDKQFRVQLRRTDGSLLDISFFGPSGFLAAYRSQEGQ